VGTISHPLAIVVVVVVVVVIIIMLRVLCDSWYDPGRCEWFQVGEFILLLWYVVVMMSFPCTRSRIVSSTTSSSMELIVFLSVVSDVINDVSVGCSVAMEDFLSILTNSDFKIIMIFQLMGRCDIMQCWVSHFGYHSFID
jgi:hypothetical protein